MLATQKGKSLSLPDLHKPQPSPLPIQLPVSSKQMRQELSKIRREQARKQAEAKNHGGATSSDALPEMNPSSGDTALRWSSAVGRREHSSAMNFLDEKLGLVKTPFLLEGKPKAQGIPHKRFLYWGVSQDFEGRHAYLKNRAVAPPQCRNFGPQSTSQEVGWQHGRRWVEDYAPYKDEIWQPAPIPEAPPTPPAQKHKKKIRAMS